jgi:hypothetical protein
VGKLRSHCSRTQQLISYESWDWNTKQQYLRELADNNQERNRTCPKAISYTAPTNLAPAFIACCPSEVSKI